MKKDNKENPKAREKPVDTAEATKKASATNESSTRNQYSGSRDFGAGESEAFQNNANEGQGAKEKLLPASRRLKMEITNIITKRPTELMSRVAIHRQEQILMIEHESALQIAYEATN